MSSWTFLTNHGHVLVCIANNPDATLREIAAQVLITERAAHRIVTELEAEGALSHRRDGRHNTYRVNLAFPLRHPLERHSKVSQLLRALAPRPNSKRKRVSD